MKEVVVLTKRGYPHATKVFAGNGGYGCEVGLIPSHPRLHPLFVHTTGESNVV